MFNKKIKIFCPFNLGKIESKRGQVGETVTWLIGTLVVIVILVVSIFIVQFYASRKGKIYEASVADDLAKKSLLSYLLTKGSDGKLIYEQLKDEENLNDYNGDLAKKIFENFYEKDYLWDVWMGIVEGNESIENDFFGKRPAGYVVGSHGVSIAYSIVSEKIKLNENKNVELVLMESGGEDYQRTKENE